MKNKAYYNILHTKPSLYICWNTTGWWEVISAAKRQSNTFIC